MPTPLRFARPALQIVVAGCCLATLWLAGYFSGRHAGYAAGETDGFVAARAEESEAVRLASLRSMMEPYAGQGTYEQVHQVGLVILERLRSVRPAIPMGAAETEKEIGVLVNEIRRDVFPESEDASDGSPPSIRVDPVKQTILVRAEGRKQAELELYLSSRDDYFEWKESLKANHP